MWTRAVVVGVLMLAGSAAGAAGPFDGQYSGVATWAGNGNYRCPQSTDVTVNVRDGKFNFGPADARVSIDVGADGSFSGQSGVRYLQGRIQGGQLTATLKADRCNYMWALRK